MIKNNNIKENINEQEDWLLMELLVVIHGVHFKKKWWEQEQQVQQLIDH